MRTADQSHVDAPDPSPRAVRDIDRQIGDRVRTVRVLRRLSQETLAGRVGLTFQQIQKYEKGTNRIAVSRMLQICAALECDLSTMLAGITAPDAGETDLVVQALDRVAGLPTPVMDAARRLAALPAAQRSAVLSLIEALDAGTSSGSA